MGKDTKVLDKIRKFGGYMSGMVMPNLGAFVGWGLLAALFIPTGWMPNEKLNEMVGPILNYLLPLLIGYTAGYNIHGQRGGVIGAFTTMGVIVGSDVTMFSGAMIMGPLSSWLLKKIDTALDGKVKPGFEMFVNNFSLGILGFALAIAGYFIIGPIVNAIIVVLTTGIKFLISKKLIPLLAVFMSPAQVLFLNNAVNHGIISPIAYAQAQEAGKSLMFLLDSNCGPSLGTLCAIALFGNLRPGDELLAPAGKPYDTLEEVIGIRPSKGSLAEYGVSYRQVELLEDGTFDYDSIRKAINEKTRLVEIQRSKGYQTRPSFSVKQIGELIAFVKSIKPDVICMVDNCYGEFVDTIEPSDVGADMVVGSLIKNPGGGLAPIGGYIAGTKECVENASYRMTCPGLGSEVGATLGVNRSFFQGFFLAPMVTKGALKGAVFAANIYEKLGFPVIPDSTEPRQDIIQAVSLGTPEGLIAFCKGIQAAAPVDSYVDPEPWDMPGYDSQVIMAAGAFVQGSSIELSADGPMKPPYAVYFQGGLTWEHAKLGVLMSLQKMVDKGLVTL